MKRHKGAVQGTIAGIIKEALIGGSPVAPPYVKRLTIEPSSSKFEIRYNEEYYLRDDFEEVLREIVEKKTERLGQYRIINNCDSYWLLVIYSGTTFSSGVKVTEYSLKSEISSPFDKIFLLDSFNLDCHELIDTAPFVRPVGLKKYPGVTIKGVQPPISD